MLRLGVFLGVVLLLVVAGHVAEAQPLSPNNAGDGGGGGQCNWRNSNRMEAGDGSSSDCRNLDTGDETNWAEAQDFQFAVPAGYFVISLTVNVLRSAESPGLVHSGVQLIDANGDRVLASELCQPAGALDCAANALYAPVPDPENARSVASFTFSNLLIPAADANNQNFGVAVKFSKIAPPDGRDTFVDHITASVVAVPPESAPAEEESSSDGGGDAGAIVAGILIPLCCILCIAGLVFFFVKNPDKWEKVKGGASGAAAKAGSGAKAGASRAGKGAKAGASKAGKGVKKAAKEAAKKPEPSAGNDQRGGDIWGDDDADVDDDGGSGSVALDDAGAAAVSPQASSVPAAGPDYRVDGHNPFKNRPDMVFEVPLAFVKKDSVSGAPQIVEDCIGLMEERYLEEEGILRLAGSSSEVKQLREDYNNGRGSWDLLSGVGDEHSVGALLKQYLRSMPVKPVLNSAQLKEAVQLYKDGDDAGAVSACSEGLAELPPDHWALTVRLFNFLHLVTSYSQSNKMSTDNLVVVFTPTLQIPSELIKLMIDHADDLFT